MTDTFASRAITFYESLREPTGLPAGVSALNPYREPEVQHIGREFYGNFFNDTHPRVFVMGINPGRFGAGVTGISFTTPQNLDQYCGIPNSLPPTPELSSRFIYQIVEAFGGAANFYSHFFLTSLYPLALVKNGKNYNFYDDRATTEALWPVITDNVRQQLQFGARRDVAVCLGRKNEQFLTRLNAENGFFERVISLDHPRYILQYKSKSIDAYIEQYISVLGGEISL
ncbi:MAG: SMUG2 DNA glycosylase family protein [Cytophagales bacterium]|nr:MAG: SMUG2 DNA glycosylase family protein [Cytophagales bacterium]